MFYLGIAHGFWVALVMKQNKGTYPEEVGFFGLKAVMTSSQLNPNPLQKGRFMHKYINQIYCKDIQLYVKISEIGMVWSHEDRKTEARFYSSEKVI